MGFFEEGKNLHIPEVMYKENFVLVVSGTRCAGKTTFVDYLIKTQSEFELVKAITTRNKREDADELNYSFVDHKYFEGKNLFVHTKYDANQYGIEYKAITDVITKGKTPVLIVTPDSFEKFASKKEFRYLTIFFDAGDTILDNRLKHLRNADEKILTKEHKIRENDRKFTNFYNYKIDTLEEKPIEEIFTLFKSLWMYRDRSGLLPKCHIEELIKFNILLRNSSTANLATASYDLSLGDEYYYKGRIKRLSNKKPFIMIEPYDYAIVTSKEDANLPNDIAGKFDLKIGLFCQGIILSNGPQVDPGFAGKLFCLLFNTSNTPVVIKREEHYATLEFNKLLDVSDGYKGKYQSKQSIIDYLPSNTLQGGLSELKKEVENLKNESIKLQTIILGIISLLLAILAIFRTLN